jgi:hypothetical protein
VEPPTTTGGGWNDNGQSVCVCVSTRVCVHVCASVCVHKSTRRLGVASGGRRDQQRPENRTRVVTNANPASSSVCYVINRTRTHGTHRIAWHLGNDKATASTTQPIFRTCEGNPAGIRGSLAVRQWPVRGCSRCTGEYLNGKNLPRLSLSLNGSVGGTDIITSSGHHSFSQRCCFHIRVGAALGDSAPTVNM